MYLVDLRNKHLKLLNVIPFQLLKPRGLQCSETNVTQSLHIYCTEHIIEHKLCMLSSNHYTVVYCTAMYRYGQVQ